MFVRYWSGYVKVDGYKSLEFGIEMFVGYRWFFKFNENGWDYLGKVYKGRKKGLGFNFDESYYL